MSGSSAEGLVMRDEGWVMTGEWWASTANCGLEKISATSVGLAEWAQLGRCRHDLVPWQRHHSNTLQTSLKYSAGCGPCQQHHSNTHTGILCIFVSTLPAISFGSCFSGVRVSVQARAVVHQLVFPQHFHFSDVRVWPSGKCGLMASMALW